MLKKITGICLCIILFLSCSNKKNNKEQYIPPVLADAAFSNVMTDNDNNDIEIQIKKNITAAAAVLPDNISSVILKNIETNSDFINEFSVILQQETYLRILVDKEHSLNADYKPDDLILLKNASYKVNRSDLFLRTAAASSLEEMAAAAKQEGLSLLASSTYRSYNNQNEVYSNYVRVMGQIEADKISARPGHSQHQLGLVVDFGSIDDSFAETREGKWMVSNASLFGWSLSYPRGYEDLTGYSWESWHYRYTGKQLASFIDNYFNGIQQYALKFIHEYETTNY